MSDKPQAAEGATSQGQESINWKQCQSDAGADPGVAKGKERSAEIER